ncbi:hypothetical protein F443_03312 [Phytophthora nicotianae P1569]|uniref:SET domain-containing protein n=1 Tax=Phytophthora nicotianae P1569 TaxID=1317065 RepID=V9FQP9_PHYNI|nr:hypothetical protein F443_03312 [Phytophthora nicotianae P1569]
MATHVAQLSGKRCTTGSSTATLHYHSMRTCRLYSEADSQGVYGVVIVSTLLDIERHQKPIAQQSHYHRAPLIEVDADADSVYGNASSPVMYREFSIPGAGYGVFAAEDLEPGDIVTWYSGDLMNSEPSDKIYVTAISGGFINGLRKPVKGEGLASFVNRETRDMSMQREKL